MSGKAAWRSKSTPGVGNRSTSPWQRRPKDGAVISGPSRPAVTGGAAPVRGHRRSPSADTQDNEQIRWRAHNWTRFRVGRLKDASADLRAAERHRMTKWDKNVFPASVLLVGQGAAAGSPLFLFAEFTAFLPRGSVGGFQLPIKNKKSKNNIVSTVQ